MAAASIRQLDDGPFGGTHLMVGDEPAGEMISASSHDRSGAVWGSIRLSDYSLAQTAYALSCSKLWPPGVALPLDLKMAPLGAVGTLGLVHRDITGAPPRGPFTQEKPSPTATYPTLWNHNAKSETRIVCLPDAQLRVRQGMEEKAAVVWNTASHIHLNLGVSVQFPTNRGSVYRSREYWWPRLAQREV